MDFDASLGYPGEGPMCSMRLFWIFFILCLVMPVQPALHPRNSADLTRLAKRIPSGLPVGRKVLPKTGSNNKGLLVAFAQWILEVAGEPLEKILEARPFDPERIADLLTLYGRDLYGSGRPYWHFSETINAITAAKPVLRRQVQGAWDLAFAWLAEEPTVHHTALPASLLLAILAVCLVWGWVREAGVFALAWGGLLRMGEAAKATRGDLVFPVDGPWGSELHPD